MGAISVGRGGERGRVREMRAGVEFRRHRIEPIDFFVQSVVAAEGFPGRAARRAAVREGIERGNVAGSTVVPDGDPRILVGVIIGVNAGIGEGTPHTRSVGVEGVGDTGELGAGRILGGGAFAKLGQLPFGIRLLERQREVDFETAPEGVAVHAARP